MRTIIILLVISLSGMHAAVVAGGSGKDSVQLPGDERGREKTRPTWIADPTEGGKTKAVVITWAKGADRDAQRQARKDAVEKLIAAYKLAPGARTKDKDSWTDAEGAMFIHLVAR